MNQAEYDIIVQAIRYGAPALAKTLELALDRTVEQANLYREEQRLKRQAELTKNTSSAKGPNKTTETKTTKTTK